MSNGRIDIEYEEVKYPLLFGMLAVRLWSEKAVSHANDNPNEVAELSIAYLVHAGMCNYSQSKLEPFPSFELAYEIADYVLSLRDGTDTAIWNCFIETRAAKRVKDNLEKKSEENIPQPIGTELNPTLSESSDLNPSNTTA